jgi:hypothetical protein
MNKIVSVEEPSEKNSRWALFIIHYEDKNGGHYEAHVFKEEFNAIMFKETLLKKGISEDDLDKYEELLYEKWNRDKLLEKA